MTKRGALNRARVNEKHRKRLPAFLVGDKVEAKGSPGYVREVTSAYTDDCVVLKDSKGNRSVLPAQDLVKVKDTQFLRLRLGDGTIGTVDKSFAGR